MIWKLGEGEIGEITEGQGSLVFLTDSAHVEVALKQAGIVYEGEIRLEDIGFCKVETQQECVIGALCIPRLMDVLGSRYRILFFVNRKNVVIVDDHDIASRQIRRLQGSRQGDNKEKFLCNFLSQFIRRDLAILGQYERRLMHLEEEVSEGNIQDFQAQIMPLRRELLSLRGYYDEMMDMGKDLEENEGHFFAKKI